MKNKRPTILTIIAIVTIIGGVVGIVGSLPLYGFYNSVQQDEVVVEEGVKIAEVQPNTPADDAQLKEGDLIISVNNKAINSSSGFVEITSTNVGREITIIVERDGKIVTTSLVPRSDPPPDEGSIGVLIADDKIEESSSDQTTLQTIIKGYLGQEQILDSLSSSNNYQDKTYIRLRALISGIVSIVIGIGLLKLRKWALYGFLILVAYVLIEPLPYLLNLGIYDTNQLQAPFPLFLNRPSFTDTAIYIVGSFIEILMVVYIFKQRRIFNTA